MSLEEKRRLLIAFDVLVRAKVNGTASEYANRLGISKSTFFRLLEYMREELNAPISYNTDKSRYVYKEDGVLFFGFVPYEIISKEELKRYTGKHGRQ
jgi:predicted DNA-binding transcriptional regulator YafY